MNIELLPRLVVNNVIIFALLILFGKILMPQWSYFHIFIFMNVMMILVYIVHRFSHEIPTFIGNVHRKYHHEHNDTPFWNHFYEFIYDFMIGGGFIGIISIIFGFTRTINPSLCFFFALSYTFVHLYDYTYQKKSKQHQSHHKELECNYGPDFYDHVFGSSCDNTIEDHNQNSLSVVFAFLIIFLYKYYLGRLGGKI